MASTFLPEAAARTTLLVLADQKQRKHLNYAGLGGRPGLEEEPAQPYNLPEITQEQWEKDFEAHSAHPGCAMAPRHACREDGLFGDMVFQRLLNVKSQNLGEWLKNYFPTFGPNLPVSIKSMTYGKDYGKKALKTVLQEIQQTPDAQDSDYNDITHDHLCGEGEIAEGDRQADSLAAPVEKAHLLDIFQLAKLSHQQYHQNVPGLIRQFQLTRSQTRAIVVTCPNCQVQAMPSMEKTYLTLNPVMNPIQVVILLLLNSLAAAWIIPQPRQNVWVTLAQTLPQENICLSIASTENPMSTCLVGIPLQAGEFPAGLDTHRSNEIPEPNTFRPYKAHQQKAVMIVNPLEEWLPSLPKGQLLLAVVAPVVQLEPGRL
ncbi:hypothetical protein DUI87_03305 [Hirundo rustica rustica]|uniref:Integrase-type domain-containing protein n=1 Tax=Hirundo rustica rustica TaxID=333673 RepID=A0A3M0L3Y2_HIRRU|nr:hypothetical protein DUI87_03305 [Hirundo rustica rustica]